MFAFPVTLVFIGSSQYTSRFWSLLTLPFIAFIMLYFHSEVFGDNRELKSNFENDLRGLITPILFCVCALYVLVITLPNMRSLFFYNRKHYAQYIYTWRLFHPEAEPGQHRKWHLGVIHNYKMWQQSGRAQMRSVVPVPPTMVQTHVHTHTRAWAYMLACSLACSRAHTRTHPCTQIQRILTSAKSIMVVPRTVVAQLFGLAPADAFYYPQRLLFGFCGSLMMVILWTYMTERLVTNFGELVLKAKFRIGDLILQVEALHTNAHGLLTHLCALACICSHPCTEGKFVCCTNACPCAQARTHAHGRA